MERAHQKTEIDVRFIRFWVYAITYNTLKGARVNFRTKREVEKGIAKVMLAAQKYGFLG